METISITTSRLANMHSHLREPAQAPHFLELAMQGGIHAILPMPNTADELTTAKKVVDYIDPLHGREYSYGMPVIVPTAFLTESTPVEEIIRCAKNDIYDFKIYPRDRTTKSENGARRYYRLIELIKIASKEVDHRLRIHMHPEHPLMAYSNRDAEFAFTPIADMFLEETNAAIIWEHGTDSNCIPVWRQFATTGRFYVTLTAHHLVTNEDRAFGDVRCVCKPPLKTEVDRGLLVSLVCEGNHWVMAGGDDAPHPVHKKHVHQGQCACGAYTAPFLLLLYAHALDELLREGDPAGVKKFDAFVSDNAKALYGGLGGWPAYLKRSSFKIPAHYRVLGELFEPFWAGRELLWSFDDRVTQVAN